MAGVSMQVQGIGQSLTKAQSPEARESQFEAILHESDVRISDPEHSLGRDFESAIDIRSLSSLNINHNPMFLELKQKLVAFYRDSIRIRPQLHKEKSKQWRLVLYTSLQKLLREVVFTPDRQQQERCLERVHKWYYEKVQRPEQVKPLSYPDKTDETFDHDETEKSLSPGPEARLKKYNRRQIASATTRSELPQSRPVTASVKQRIPLEEFVDKTDSIAFTGFGDPVLNESRADFGTTFLHYEPYDEDSDKRVETRLQQILNKEQSDDRIEREMREKVYAWTATRARQEEETTRKTEGIRFASRFEARGVRTRPVTALPGINRVQSKSPMRSSTPVVDLSQDPPPPIELLPPDDPLETTSPKVDDPYYQNYERIARMRKIHGSLIEASEHHFESEKRFMDAKNEQTSLSAYTRKVVPPRENNVRPESAPRSRAVITGGLKIEHRPLSAGRVNQLEEIAEVKNKLARQGIPCKYENLAAALLVPEDLPPSKLTAENLPPDGARLMSNPFIKLKKKKKKKKGKKKKSS